MFSTDPNRTWILLAGTVIGYLLVMFTNPARASLRDGFRCLGRYGKVWTMLMLFGLCYSLFQIGMDVLYYFNAPDGDRPVFQWMRPWFLPGPTLLQILKVSVLPAVESVAGVFNVLITTFPFSAIAAIMFLSNWDGHHLVLARALRRRFGLWGWGIHLGILICAVAAIIKPLFYTLLLMLNKEMSGLAIAQCGLIIDWLSFLFEYLFGVCVQIYLILMVYAWVRGLSFTNQHLLDFAIRRFSYVMKWSGIVMVISTLFIHLPSILSYVPPFSHFLSPESDLEYHLSWVRPGIALFLLLFSGMQIILAFHSESIRKAIRDYFGLIRKDAWAVGWFLVIAMMHFYILNVINNVVIAGFTSLPDGTFSVVHNITAVTLVWRLIFPMLAAFVSGWMLATWVCLYKRSEAGRIHADNWIQY